MATKPLSFKGTQSTRTIPDTVDLANHARLALQGLSNMIDVDNDYYMWFAGWLDSRQPHFSHSSSDYACTIKILEAMPLLRAACGDESHLDIEQGILEQHLRMIDPNDGIPYAPWSEKRPWHAGHFAFGYEGSKDDWCWAGLPGLYLRTLSGWMAARGESWMEEAIHKLVGGVEKMLVFKEDYAYFPDAGIGLHQYAYPRSGWTHDREPEGEQVCCEGSELDTQARTLHGLSAWYAISGDTKARKLMDAQTKFILKHKMWGGLVEEIGVCGAEQGHGHSHHHGRLSGLRAVMAYGMATGNDHAMEFARRGYENMRTFMVPRIGWVAANGVGDAPVWMEGCCHAGLIWLAIRLSDAGLGDYWDDVDAMVRNMLTEQQMTDVEKIRTLTEHFPDTSDRFKLPGEVHRCDHEEYVGLFGAWSDFNCIPPTVLMGCCQGNASMALGYAHEAALRCKGDTAEINLLINRSSPLVDVDSFIPYSGKVLINNKAAKRIAARVPSWVDRKHLTCSVNQTKVEIPIIGNRVFLDGLAAGDTIELTFPTRKSTDRYTVHNRVWRQNKTATFRFRNGTVVDVSPKVNPAGGISIFDRGYFETTEAPMKTSTTYSVNNPILHW